MTEAGYDVINAVHCRVQMDANRFAAIRSAFAGHFAELAKRTKLEKKQRQRARLAATRRLPG
jgi:hypothetical protein